MHDARNFTFYLVLAAALLLPSLGCAKKGPAKNEPLTSERIRSDKNAAVKPGAEHDHAAEGHAHADDQTQLPSGAPVNTKCPITGDPINPKLTIEYKGKSVGLCCKDCIADWNKLTDAEKDAKLKQ